MNSPIEHDSPGGLVVAPATVETVMARIASYGLAVVSRDSRLIVKAVEQVRAEVERLSRLSAAPVQEPVATDVIAGALFDLMGMLTSQDDVMTFSSRHDASPAVEQLRKFAAKRGLPLEPCDATGWSKRLTPQPAPAGQALHRDLSGLAKALRQQRHIDEDGSECGVSRQAVDEAATILEQLAALSPYTQVKSGNTNEQGAKA